MIGIYSMISINIFFESGYCYGRLLIIELCIFFFGIFTDLKQVFDSHFTQHYRNDFLKPNNKEMYFSSLIKYMHHIVLCFD